MHLSILTIPSPRPGHPPLPGRHCSYQLVSGWLRLHVGVTHETWTLSSPPLALSNKSPTGIESVAPHALCFCSSSIHSDTFHPRLSRLVFLWIYLSIPYSVLSVFWTHDTSHLNYLLCKHVFTSLIKLLNCDLTYFCVFSFCPEDNLLEGRNHILFLHIPINWDHTVQRIEIFAQGTDRGNRTDTLVKGRLQWKINISGYKAFYHNSQKWTWQRCRDSLALTCVCKLDKREEKELSLSLFKLEWYA